jgi:Tfp pilus assembly protein PilO
MNEIRSKRSRRRQQMWIYLIGVLFVADFVFYGYMPSDRRLRSLKEVRAQQERTIATAAAQGKELPALKLRLKNVEKIVEHYEAYVPEEDLLGVFLQSMAKMMTEHHLTDQGVVPGTAIESGGANRIPVHVNCTGTLNDIYGFFRDFQAMDRLVRIEKAVLKNDSGFTGQIGMHTEAVIFYRPQTQQRINDLADGTSAKAVKNDA